MKITKRKTAAIVLALVLILGLSAPAYATGATKTNGEHQTVATGGSITAFIDANGDLYVCGNNYYGQIGDGTTSNASAPKKVLSNVIDVSCGYNFTAAITSDHSLYLWGDNSSGQLGTGNTTGSTTPVKVLSNVQSVCCSPSSDNLYTAAVTTDGTLYVWGNTRYGQSGSSKSYSTPTKVLTKVSAVSCGDRHIAVIKTDNTLWTWGGNNDGQLGNGKTKDRTDPVKVLDKVATVSCGTNYTAAITNNGALYTWGGNRYGQLGTGSYDSSSSPVHVLSNVFSVSCGETHTVAVANNGELYVWGSKNNGQLGIQLRQESNDCITSPYRIASSIAIAYSGLWDTAVVDQTGTLWTCGYSGNNSLGYSGGDLVYTSGGQSYQLQTTLKPVYNYSVRLPNVRPSTNEPVQPPRPGGNTPSNDYVGNFTDVSRNAYYADAVQWAIRNGVTSGTSSTTFSPNKECTLAEFVTMLWRACGKPSSSQSCPFSIQPSSPYYTALCWAEEKGILDREGISTGTIVTRKMAVQYLWRQAGCPNVNHLCQFKDVPRSANYVNAVTWAVDCRITGGTGNNEFQPDTICTRAQIVTFLYRDSYLQ